MFHNSLGADARQKKDVAPAAKGAKRSAAAVAADAEDVDEAEKSAPAGKKPATGRSAADSAKEAKAVAKLSDAPEVNAAEETPVRSLCSPTK